MAPLFKFLVGMEMRVYQTYLILLKAKAPEDLITQMQALNLLESKTICST